jgi:hypothetical protein
MSQTNGKSLKSKLIKAAPSTMQRWWHGRKFLELMHKIIGNRGINYMLFTKNADAKYLLN